MLLLLWRPLRWASGEGSEWASPPGPAFPPAQRDHSREGSEGRSLSPTWGLRYVFPAAAPMRCHKYKCDLQSVHAYSGPCNDMAPLQALNPAAPADPKCTGQLAKSRSLFLNQLIEALASDTFQPQGGTGLQVFLLLLFYLFNTERHDQ